LSRRLIVSERIFHGLVFDVERDRLIDETGAEVVREVVRHPGGAGGLPLFADDRIALVRQYRHPAGVELLEIPAGRIEPGESPAECAAREIASEVGERPGHLEMLSEFFSTPGFCEEKLHIYLATDFTQTSQNLDDDEVIEVVYLTLTEAMRLIEKGEIVDAKTIIAILLASNRLQNDVSD